MEPEQYERGCFNWYRYRSGDFVTGMANAIIRADNVNLARIKKAFPQMVAAHAQHSWDIVPMGFEPRYNAD